jgi:hypothetical protein
MTAKPEPARLDHGAAILGHVDQHRAGLRYGEAAHTGRAAGHRDRDVEPQPALGRLRDATDHPDRLRAPQRLNQPLFLWIAVFELGGRHHREQQLSFTGGRAHRIASGSWRALGHRRGVSEPRDGQDGPRGQAAAQSPCWRPWAPMCCTGLSRLVRGAIAAKENCGQWGSSDQLFWRAPLRRAARSLASLNR